MPKRIRLAFYMYTPAIGGAERHLRDLLWSLDRDRYEVTLFHEPWSEFEQFLGLESCPALQHVPIPIHEVDRRLRNLERRPTRYLTITRQQLARFFWTLPDFRRLQAAFASRPIDILHIDNGGYPGAWTARWASLAAKSIGIPKCVMTVANTPVGPQFPVWLDRNLDRRVVRSVDVFAAVSDEVARVLQAKHHVPADKIATLYYGVEEPHVEMTTAERLELRARWGLPANVSVIGMAARLDPVKGHRYLLDAFTQLPTDVAALIIGGGPMLDTIKQSIGQLGLEARVKLTGALSHGEALRAMAVCDVITLPSEIEGLPYVVLEAMSLGKPVVASGVGGIPEQIVDGITGLVVPPRDTTALTQALAQLAHQPDLARAMGAAAHARFETQFSITKMLSEHEALYAQVSQYHSSSKSIQSGSEKR